jgi:cytochrome o ubiquinol oxidase subunit 1
LIIQLVVSIWKRHENRDAIGDPWDGRSLEWATSSPPPAYNFAVIPEVRCIDAFMDMKEKGVAYVRPTSYQAIYLPRNTGIGVIFGGSAFVFGFAMIWYIWWLAMAAGLAMLAVIIVHSFDDDNEHCISAAEIELIEDRRFSVLREAKQTLSNDPLHVLSGVDL